MRALVYITGVVDPIEVYDVESYEKTSESVVFKTAKGETVFNNIIVKYFCIQEWNNNN